MTIHVLMMQQDALVGWLLVAPSLVLVLGVTLQPISMDVQVFNNRYSAQPQLVQATSLMAMVLLLVVFFLAQKVFMRGVVITGVEK